MTHEEISALIAANGPLPEGLTTTGNLYLRGYAHALPSSLTTTGNLDLEGYAHALPPALLDRYKNDLFEILTVSCGEIPNLLAALREGKVDGSTYAGDCACLVGTLERSGNVTLPHNPDRPAEKWFLGISDGETPSTNIYARQAEEWMLEFLAGRIGTMASGGVVTI